MIPYKLAKNNHQEENAKWFVGKGGGVILPEDELTEDKLIKQLMIFIKNKEKLKKMSKSSFSLGDDKSLLKLSKTINL